jgi:hypothetical protein
VSQKMPSSRGNSLTMHEVEDAGFRAQPLKFPSLDEISAIVWKELWPALGRWIFLLFEALS